MADASRAEKLAAARRKLKEFKEKNKEAANNARSTPSSQKSASPVESNVNIKDLSLEFNGSKNSISFIHSENRNAELAIKESSNGVTNGNSKQDVTTLFSFQSITPSNENNTSGNFFDNIPQDTSNSNVNLNFELEAAPSLQPVIADTPSDVTEGTEHRNGEHLHPVSDKTKEGEYELRIAHLEERVLFDRNYIEDLQRKLSDSHGHILSLQQEIKRLNEEQNQKAALEVVELEEKLKFQLQTIEILVSEKSELQKELYNLQEELKTNGNKCEELSSRLKASRSQVQKLERDLSERSESKSQHNGILKRLENELQQKESIVQDALHNLGEARNEIRELERRVEVGLRDQEELRRQLQEKDKLYSMAQIKLTQLGGGETEGNSLKEIENLKIDLEKSRKDTEIAIEEKKKCETELRQYISSLNAQVLQANAKCERTEKDREELAARIDDLVKHLSELEKQLQREKSNNEPADESEVVKALRQEVSDVQLQLENKVEQYKALENHLHELQEKLFEADLLKENVPNMSLLQAAMESDRVAAARAIEQNNALKQKLTDLEEYILKINNSKLELTEDLDKYRHMAGDYRLQLEKFKSRQEMRWVDSVTQTNCIRKSNSDTQTAVEDMIQNLEPHEPVSIETLVMIEDKLKKTMDRVADLSDEKQMLEHLVLQLQSETETIGEYVTLYQNQRSLLKEKEEEKERQMALIAKERSELKSKLDQINILLTKFPHNPDVEDTTCKISSLLGEIQSSSIVQDKGGPPSTFHPCLLCSGKLINV